MLDRDKLELKVQNILRKELTDEEFLQVRVEVVKSVEDKMRESALVEGARLAEIDRLHQIEAELDANINIALAELAIEVGVEELPYTPFTRSVALHKCNKGFISPKQIAILKKLKTDPNRPKDLKEYIVHVPESPFNRKKIN